MSTVREPVVDVAAMTLRPTGRPTIEEVGSSDDRTIDAAATGTGSTVMADLAELEPGAVIARYRILGRLGAGGMGVVYRAHDAQLDRDVALKLLRVGEDGTEGRTRMLREAKAAAKIRHPNVVTVYDAGEVFGRVFIAMELIDGVTLKAFFCGRKRIWREVVEIMLGAGEGLAAAHVAGLVHRDFKPDNVLVETGGRVRVLDFGLARPASESEGPTMLSASVASMGDGPPMLRTLTQTGTLVGTPAYMAPEQHLCRGVEARSDQFAYCVTFFECLFGHRPFAGDTQAELTMNVVEGRMLPPKDRGDVPTEIVAALHRGLAVDPADRHDALVDLLAEMRASLRRHAPHDRRTLLIAAGVMLPLLFGTAAYVASQDDPPAATQQALPSRVVVDPPDEVPVVRGLDGPPGVSLAPERSGVTIGQPRAFTAAVFAELVAGILPEGLDVETNTAGVRVVGTGAGAWRESIQLLLSALDADNSRRPPGALLTQFTTPDGFCALYLLGADQYTGLKTEALRAVPGVQRIGRSEALRAVLVLGSGEAQSGVGELLRRAKAPRYREWCFVNDKMGDSKHCFTSREACEREEAEWFDRKGHCKGVK